MSEQLFPRNTFQRLMDTIAFVAAVQQRVEANIPTRSLIRTREKFVLFLLCRARTFAEDGDLRGYLNFVNGLNIPIEYKNCVWIDYAPQHGHYVPFQDVHNRGRRI